MKHAILVPALLVLACIAVFVPSVGLFQFQNPMERLAVASAVETARQGQWLIPQLEGTARVNKPPLQTWLSMPLLKPATISRLSDPAPAERAGGFHSLAWQVRIIPVVINCLFAAAVYGLALHFGPPRYALLAAIIAITNSLFLDHVRLASYDPALATWVGFTNLFLAQAIFRRRLWRGCLLAAVFLSFAFLTKGPVAMLQTVLPALLFLVWRSTTTGESTTPQLSASPRRLWPPILAAVLVFLALTIPWFVYFLRQNPTALTEWYRQIFRDLPNKPDSPLTYLRILYWMLPWTPCLLIGAAFAALQTFRRQDHPLVYGFFLMAVPVAIMTCFPHRTERYLVPLVPALALLAAAPLQWVFDQFAFNFPHHALSRGFAAQPPSEVLAARFASLLLLLQWILILAAALFVPIYGHWFAKTLSHEPRFSLQTATLAITAVLVVGGLAMVPWRRRYAFFLAATMLLSWGGNTLYLVGWQASAKGTPEGLSLTSAIADAFPPTVPVYCILPPGRHPPSELLLYLNRVLTVVDSPDKIPQNILPLVVLTSHPTGKPPPAPVPLPAARHLGSSEISGELFDAYCLPAPDLPDNHSTSRPDANPLQTSREPSVKP